MTRGDRFRLTCDAPHGLAELRSWMIGTVLSPRVEVVTERGETVLWPLVRIDHLDAVYALAPESIEITTPAGVAS